LENKNVASEMKRTLIALLTVAIVGAILFAGCVGAPPPAAPPAEAPLEPQIPANYTTYTDEAGIFSISYPPDWEPALFLIEDLDKATEELLTSIEEDLPLERTRTLFLAGLPTGTGYAPNVKVLVKSLPGIILTHDQVVEAEIQGIKDAVGDSQKFSRVKTTIGGREATIVDWEGTVPLGLHSLQAIILVGKVVWVVTCLPPAGEFSKWESDFHAIVRSLRILK
jgi:hypothetical protein